jgi:adenylate cyclase class IV
MSIEVEKKFLLNEADKARLTAGASFANERIITDTYYDTEDYRLTSQDWWLRARDGRFELKIPLHGKGRRPVDQYDELENESEIKKALGMTTGENLADVLSAHGYRPFGILKTTRRKYKRGAFTIDLDSVDLPGSAYDLGEIELMVEDRSEIADAIDKIIDFAKSKQLKITPARGKISEYLRRSRPEHYQALIKSGVVHNFD